MRTPWLAETAVIAENVSVRRGVRRMQYLLWMRALPIAVAMTLVASACGGALATPPGSDGGSAQTTSQPTGDSTTGTGTATDTDVHSIMTPYVDSGSDTGCITTAVPGAACEQGQRVCTLNLPCQPIWSCDPTSHWQEGVPACGGSPGSPDDVAVDGSDP